ncbi:hypothetical protein RRF57_001396 [Xylaria bambusicola]|uniref:Uncharacterized protein n=1 Tax=Xylaria bambusicola TaxID=326684 RepID=A0AAN7U4V2_9PEZI
MSGGGVIPSSSHGARGSTASAQVRKGATCDGAVESTHRQMCIRISWGKILKVVRPSAEDTSSAESSRNDPTAKVCAGEAEVEAETKGVAGAEGVTNAKGVTGKGVASASGSDSSSPSSSLSLTSS